MLICMPVHILGLGIVSRAERALDSGCLGGSFVPLAKRLMLFQILPFFDLFATELAGDVLVSREMYLFVLSQPALGGEGLLTLITRMGVVG